MPKKSKSLPRLPVEARAEVSAKATASYKREKKITENIQEDVTRAKAGAWLTIISPLTEWAGLKGDQLRHKREIFRLQQEETLAKFSEKVRETIKKGVEIARPVPAKILVPLLENVSLEHPDGEEIVEAWANLLISAASEKSIPSRFVTLLRELNGEQARLFRRNVENNSELYERPWQVFECVTAKCENELTHLLKLKKLNAEQIIYAVIEIIDIPGCAVEDEIVSLSDGGMLTTGMSDDDLYNIETMDAISIFESLGLLNGINVHRMVGRSGIESVSIHYSYCTSLGNNFFEAVTKESPVLWPRRPPVDTDGSGPLE